MIFEKRIINLFKKSVITRQDTPEELYVFTHDKFPGLLSEKFTFKNNHGDNLIGAFYYYGEKDPTRVVIFEHGMGGGHLSYMKEIEALVSRSFTVLSYDHTGCAESEGDNIVGFSQSLADLDCLINTLRADDKYKNLDLSVVGHSWGGYSTLNIAAYHPDITHIVPISGFISAGAILSQFLGGIMKLYVHSLVKYEERINTGYAHSSAINSLKNSRVKALIIHSDDDPTVKYDLHFAKLKAALKNRSNTEFLNIPGRKHNPNYTSEAVAYLGECVTELVKCRRAGELVTSEQKTEFRNRFDWDKMTEQDTLLWDKIRDFLNT